MPAERRLAADREDDRVLHQRRELVLRVGERLALLLGREQIPLGDDEDDLVARRLEELVVQEDALALLEDLPGVEQEEHRVGARDVAVRDVGALEREVVHAWRVDEEDALAQERRRVADLEVVDLVARLVAPPPDGEALGLVEGERTLLAARSSTTNASGVSAQWMWWIVAVVGVTPTGSACSPRSAFTNVDLPWLNSPDDDEVEAVLLELPHELAVDALAQALRAERARHVARARAGPRRSRRASRRTRRARACAGVVAPLCPLVVVITRLPSGAPRHGCRPRSSSDPSPAVPTAAAIELALAEDAHREHALGEPRVRREDLHVLADPVAALLVLLEERVEVELVVELARPEGELGDRALGGLPGRG